MYLSSHVAKEAHLFYKDSRSDKVYHINLERSPGTLDMWKVLVKFGPREGTLTHVDLTKGHDFYNTALMLYDKRLGEKLAKGYQHINDTKADLIQRIMNNSSLPWFTKETRENLADFILAYVEERA